jgi:uncharacterized protein (TIGR02217 family)
MSNEVLNDSLNHFSYPYKYQPKFLNSVQKNPTGTVKQVFSHTNHDFLVFALDVADYTSSQMDTLADFISAHGGDRENFLFKDEYGYGYEVARQEIDTGDGSETEFQLIETVSVGSQSIDYQRWDIIASSYTVWVDGTEQTEGAGNDYTLDTTESGIITFNSAPGNTLSIEASFEYYRRCRFVQVPQIIYSKYDTNNTLLVFEEEGI